MSASPHTQQFLAFFKLTEADLAQNRQGAVSSTQIQHSQQVWERFRLGGLMIGIGSVLFIAWNVLNTRPFALDAISAPLVLLSIIAFAMARIAIVRKDQIATLPLRTQEDLLETRYQQTLKGSRSRMVYRAGTDQRISGIPEDALSLIVPGIRYRIYFVGLEVVCIEPLGDPAVLPTPSSFLQRYVGMKRAIIAFTSLLALSGGLQMIESYLMRNTSSPSMYTPLMNSTKVVTAAGILSRHENGYAFVPDREEGIPFPSVPHRGYVILERDPMLVQAVGEHGRWRAIVTLDTFRRTTSSSGDELRAHVVSITNIERIPEEE